MMDGDAKQFRSSGKPVRIDLFGDKVRKIESATHIITFPGGAIELSRTTDGDYWAHIIVNRYGQTNLTNDLNSARGEVIRSRLDLGDRERGIIDIPEADKARQIAVLIRSTKGTR